MALFQGIVLTDHCALTFLSNATCAGMNSTGAGLAALP